MTNIYEDQKSVLRDCTERFERLGVEYMLTGSMAMVNYAIMRMTADIDIVVELRRNDIDGFIKEFGQDYYIPQGRVRDAVSRRFMFNILHNEKLVKVDCVIRKKTEFQKQAFARRERIKFADDFSIWIISREDLILSKLSWAKDSKSEMQMRDVANILRNGYDEKYVESWAEKLKVTDLLNEALRKLEENAE